MHFHRPLKKADFPTAMTFWRLMDLQTDNDTFLFEKCQFPLMTEVMSSLCGDSANKKSLLHSKWSQLSVKNWQYLCHVQRSCDCVTTCYFFNRLHICVCRASQVPVSVCVIPQMDAPQLKLSLGSTSGRQQSISFVPLTLCFFSSHII